MGREQKSIQEAEDMGVDQVARRRKAKTKEDRPPKKINALIRAPVA